MKKRLFKKAVKKMSNTKLYEHVANCENEMKNQTLHNEFDKRFPELNNKAKE